MRFALGIDPGTHRSALVMLRLSDMKIEPGERLIVPPTRAEMCWHEYLPNRDAERELEALGAPGLRATGPLVVVIEQPIMNYGTVVGHDFLRTVGWAARFEAACERKQIDCRLVSPQAVRRTLTGQPSAPADAPKKALLGMFGGRKVAVGAVRCKGCKGKGWVGRDHAPCGQCRGDGWEHPPGPLNGIRDHEWSALAVVAAWLMGADEEVLS